MIVSAASRSLITTKEDPTGVRMCKSLAYVVGGKCALAVVQSVEENKTVASLFISKDDDDGFLIPTSIEQGSIELNSPDPGCNN